MKLSPTTHKNKEIPIYGLDTEWCDNNQTFILGAIDKDVFYTKRDLIDALKETKYRNSIIATTNLAFDFYGLMQGQKELAGFKKITDGKGSRLLAALSYIDKDGNFNYQYEKNSYKLLLYDTWNYAPLSVEKWGKILGVKKIAIDSIGEMPKTNQEWHDLKERCIIDADISKRAIQFLFKSFNILRANPSITIGATAVSYFKNNFLDRDIWVQPESILLDSFNSYYGGMVHAYERGLFHNVRSYDVNSLYPSVMVNEYPDPNTVRRTKKNTDYYIMGYDGCSDVSIHCPYMDYPLLPVRYDNKTIFPTGSFRGWFTHVELRRAIDLGYVIKKVHNTIYYTKSYKPFEVMMQELWKLRLSYQDEKSPMELVVKLLMNSFYGKTGQKFINKEQWIHISNISYDELQKLDFIELVGDHYRIKKTELPKAFCIPIWAAQTTSYGRIVINRLIKESRALYSDTDCVKVLKKLPTNPRKLGGLKDETRGEPIKNFISVKSKMYLEDHKAVVKSLSKATKEDFYNILRGKPIPKEKWTKFKEWKRTGRNINEIYIMEKLFDLEDTKRVWSKPFNYLEQQSSKPIHLDNGVPINLNKETNKPISNEAIKHTII